MNTEILITDFQAARKAKSDFANILGISRESVHVKHDSFHEKRYGSTQCNCGETRAVYFEMTNAGPKQLEKLEKAIPRAGGVLMYGVCEHCGKEF